MLDKTQSTDRIAEKVKFINQYKKFVSNGFQKKHFPKWFYVRLSMTFGHIAHYNQQGFYDYWFDSEENKQQFIEQHKKWPCYGEPEYTYSDAENEIREWLYQRG